MCERRVEEGDHARSGCDWRRAQLWREDEKRHVRVVGVCIGNVVCVRMEEERGS